MSMVGPVQTIVDASKKALSGTKAKILFVVSSLALFFLFEFVPVLTTPGDDLAFQVHITPTPVLVLLAVLAVLNGLLLTMHLYIRRIGKERALGAKQAAGGLGLLTGSIVSAIGCASCYSSLLALFGLGGVTFVVQYRWWISGATLVFALLALYYTSKRIESGCKVCSI